MAGPTTASAGLTGSLTTAGLVALASVLASVATPAPASAQDSSTRDWLGVQGWSGKVSVEVTVTGAPEPFEGRLVASGSSVVTLDLDELREGPARAIWRGTDNRFSINYDAQTSGGGIVMSESGSGTSPGGEVLLLVNADDGTYVVDVEHLGDGVQGQYSVTYPGGYGNESGTSTIHADVLTARSDPVPLPGSLGPLSGSQPVDVSFPSNLGFGPGGQTGTLSWSLVPCTSVEEVALAIDPLGWDQVVFDASGTPGSALQVAMANGVRPAELEPLLQWTFPELVAVSLATTPEEPVGNNVWLEYRPMPDANEDFAGEHRVEVELAGCTRATASLPVRFYFELEGRGNLEEPQVPNWFYYWRQTRAGHGLGPDQVRYWNTAQCGADTYGWYVGGDYVIVCDPASGTSWNTVTGEYTSGIDTYAATLLHELEHKRHQEEWWDAFGEDLYRRYPGETPADSAARERERKRVDADGDDIPDRLERDLGFDPGEKDTYRCKMTDEHYLAWLAEGLWAAGSADEEDWAWPGKQSGGEPAAPASPGALCGIAAGRRPPP